MGLISFVKSAGEKLFGASEAKAATADDLHKELVKHGLDTSGKGNGGKYDTIFQANRPMLTHPDKIYPGQVLRIPPMS